MADVEYDPYSYAPYEEETPVERSAGEGLRTLVNWSGAIVSLSLVAGLAIWGYRLSVADVSGVPVVRALEGPMRIAPEDPGGSQAAHQGLAVNSVAAEGEAEAPADTLRLAPRPVSLTAEDLPRADLPPVAVVTEVPVVPASVDRDAAVSADVAANAKLVEELAASVAPDAETLPEEAVETAAIAVPVEEVVDISPAVPKTAGGLTRAPVPPARPARSVSAAVSAAAAVAANVSGPEATRAAPPSGIAAAVAAAVEMPPESIMAGTNLVQLGAFDSPEIARSEWARLADRFDSFMAGKTRVVQSATSGGRTFYRLRAAGFDDIADARRFCAALTAENADCIPVVAR